MTALLQHVWQGEQLVKKHKGVKVRGYRGGKPDPAGNQERYMVYVMGWKDGAAARAQRPNLIDHVRDDLREAYFKGYQDGYSARAKMALHAAVTYGYKPTVLRAQ